MLKTIIVSKYSQVVKDYPDAVEEYTVQINKLFGENPMICPVCSHTRDKDKQECLYFNAGMGAGRCNHCDVVFYEKKSKSLVNKKRIKPLKHIDTRDTYIRKYFKKRQIPSSVAIKEGVTTANRDFRIDGEFIAKKAICYNYLVGTEILFKKYKTLEKDFSKDGSPEFFYGHNNLIQSALFTEDKKIIVVEGEDDRLCYLSAGFKYVVSPPTGSKGIGFLDKYDKFFDQIKKIYIAVDQDEEGYNLEQEIIRRYNIGNCYKVDLKDCKDANDYLRKYGVEELRNTISNAKSIPTQGTVRFSDVKDKAWHIIKYGYTKGISTGYPSLDRYFTWRPKDMTLFSGYANHGKTTLLSNLAVLKSIINGWKWAIFTPEYGAAEDFYLDMCEIYLGKTMITTKESRRSATDSQIEEAMQFIGDHFFFVYPENESHTLEHIMKEVSVNVKAHGINGVIIDPFNQLHRSVAKTARDIIVQQFIRRAKYYITKYNLVFAVVVHPRSANERNPQEPNQYCIEEGDSWNKGVDN